MTRLTTQQIAVEMARHRGADGDTVLALSATEQYALAEKIAALQGEPTTLPVKIAGTVIAALILSPLLGGLLLLSRLIWQAVL
jgi:hypothetical protein